MKVPLATWRAVDAVFFCEASTQEPEVEVNMAVAREGKTGNIISSREHYDGQFQTIEDTLRIILRNSLTFGVNSFRSFGVYREQTNKQTNTFNYIYR